MNLHFTIAGYGFVLQIWVNDFDLQSQTIFNFALIRKWRVLRGERWTWLDDLGQGRLGFERIRDGETVDGWYLTGPIVRLVPR